MNLRTHLKELIEQVGSSQITPSAYDTAWVARLSELGEPIGERALNWLRANQLEDGSWGAEDPIHYHDRAVCTLAAIIALARSGDDQDLSIIDRGKVAFEDAIYKLRFDVSGETIGFEIIIPTLLAEAESLGILQLPRSRLLDDYRAIRKAKLDKLPAGTINRCVSMAFSAEMVGSDGLDLLDIENLREKNGSVAYNPAATSFFARYVSLKDADALNYLETVAIDGAVPYTAPINTFERGWALASLSLIGDMDDEIFNLCKTHIQHLKKQWIQGKGISAVGGLSLTDGDTTALVFEVLARFGDPPDLDALFSYEDKHHFRCFDYESNPSITTNIHMLSALRFLNFDNSHTSVQKIVKYLEKEKTDQGFWIDKWHISPYYPTSHLIIACLNYENELIKDSVEWVMKTQKPNGSWGFYFPTAEETAYCLQSLICWRRAGNIVPDEILFKGLNWLEANFKPPFPQLWTGKSLYCPILVVKSAILSALILCKQSLG